MAPPKKKSTSTIVTRSASAAAVSPVLPEPMGTVTQNPSSTATSSEKAAAGSSTPPRPPPASSPTKCAICLGDLVNSCYTNSCMHQFCFACLLQWSKVKPECPLCKSLFQSIYHNIRSNDDYDEYNVPSPTETMPSLSIHFAHHDAFAHAPGPYRTAATFRRLNHVHSLFTPPPFTGGDYHDHGYSFHRFMSRERARVDRMRDPSYIRILEMGPLSEPRAFDLMNMNTSVGPRAGLDNPFYSDEPELFGSFSMGPGPSSSSSSRTPSTTLGYTRRRRIYDRGQYVRAFNASTIPPGTVFFPSVEYFRTHPGSYARVSEWLHRELTVLLGLSYSRSEMANIYDTIFSILFRYDIRSSEFREMIRSYLNDRTRHFQHEFYNFVLSGMRIEEYDRLAVYTSPSRGGPSAAGGESSAAVSHSDEPVFITITSSDDEANEDENDIAEVDVSYPVREGTSSDRRNSRASVIQNPEIVLSDDESPQDRVVPGTSTAPQGLYEVPVAEMLESSSSPSLDSILHTRDQIPPPPAFDTSDRDERERVSRERAIADRTARIVELRYKHRNSRDLSSRDRDQSIEQARARRLDEIRSRLVDVDDLWDSRPYYPAPPPAHSSSSASTSLEFLRPSRDGRPHGNQASTSNSDGRYLGSGFSIEQSALSSEPGPSRSRYDDGGYFSVDLSANLLSGGPPNAVPNRDSNLSCAPLTSGVGVRISQSGGSLSRIETNSNSGRRRPSPPRLNNSIEEVAIPPRQNTFTAPPTSSPPIVSDDSDEVELLGVHAIVKPPPLAVITLSSDEEDGDGDEARRLKTENHGGRNQGTSQAPPSPDLVIDDDFLNWTMDRTSRPFDMFPLTDNDDVQPIMDFRPDPPPASATTQLSTSTRTSSHSLLLYAGSLNSHSPPPPSTWKLCKKKCSSSKAKSKSRTKKSSKSKKKKSRRNIFSSMSESEEDSPNSSQQDSDVKRLKHGKRTKRHCKKRKAKESETSSTKPSREEKKMVTINRLIADMESKEKKKEATGTGSTRESKRRKRKKIISPSPSSSSSTSESDADSDEPTASKTKKLSKTQSPVPGPSSSHASTSAPGPSTSFSNQLTSNVGLLDLRTLGKKVVPSRNRERRWESDDGEENEDVSMGHNLINEGSNSDSSDSTSSEFGGNLDVETYGTRSSRSRPSTAPSFFGHRDSDEVSNSSEGEPLFAPETDSDVMSNPYEPDSGRRASNRPSRSSTVGGFFSLSPPRSTVQDLSLTTGPHSVLEGSSSGNEGRSSLTYPFVVPSSSEDENTLLDLRVASGSTILTENENDDLTSRSSSSAEGREGEGYWSEAHDWMTEK